MKNKWIFIGISVIFIMVVGVIIFLHFTAPEVLTKTPFELVTGRDIRDRVNDISPPEKIVDEVFIVPNNLWQNASHHAGWVQFAGVPVGTKLYAPVGGWHVHVRQMTFEGTIFSAIILAQNPNWGQGDLAYQETMRNMLFIARWIEVTNFNPREGEIFAEIKDTSFFPAVYAYFDEKTVLVITTDAIWAEKADFSITDPKTYLRTIIEKIN